MSLILYHVRTNPRRYTFCGSKMDVLKTVAWPAADFDSVDALNNPVQEFLFTSSVLEQGRT